MTQNTADQNTQQIRKPAGPQKDRSRLRFGLKNALAIALVAGSMTLVGLCARKKPGPDKDKKPVKEKVVTKPCPPLPSAPNNKDNKCEWEKGEHDPYSPLYDPACGYCGDDMQQKWENKENCPVDFLCEKGNERYWRQTFAKFEPITFGKLKLVTVKITHSCKKSDSSTRRRRRRRTTITTPRPMTVTPTVTVKPGGPCRGGDPSTIRAIKNAAFTALDSASPSIRNAHNPQGARFLVTLRIYVSPSGGITGKSVSSRCIGQCDTAKLNARKYVNLSAIPSTIGAAPGAKCYLTYKRVYK